MWPLLSTITVCHLKDSIWLFLLKTKVYVQIVLGPEKFHFSVPVSIMGVLEINDSLSNLSTQNILRKRKTSFFINYSLFNILQNCWTNKNVIWHHPPPIIVIPAWPQGSLERGTNPCFSWQYEDLPFFSNKYIAPAITQSSNLKAEGTVYGSCFRIIQYLPILHFP